MSDSDAESSIISYETDRSDRGDEITSALLLKVAQAQDDSDSVDLDSFKLPTPRNQRGDFQEMSFKLPTPRNQRGDFQEMSFKLPTPRNQQDDFQEMSFKLPTPRNQQDDFQEMSFKLPTPRNQQDDFQEMSFKLPTPRNQQDDFQEMSFKLPTPRNQQDDFQEMSFKLPTPRNQKDDFQEMSFKLPTPRNQKDDFQEMSFKLPTPRNQGDEMSTLKGARESVNQRTYKQIEKGQANSLEIAHELETKKAMMKKQLEKRRQRQRDQAATRVQAFDKRLDQAQANSKEIAHELESEKKRAHANLLERRKRARQKKKRKENEDPVLAVFDILTPSGRDHFTFRDVNQALTSMALIQRILRDERLSSLLPLLPTHSRETAFAKLLGTDAPIRSAKVTQQQFLAMVANKAPEHAREARHEALLLRLKEQVRRVSTRKAVAAGKMKSTKEKKIKKGNKNKKNKNKSSLSDKSAERKQQKEEKEKQQEKEDLLRKVNRLKHDV
eukprot:g5000.t1